MRPIPLGLSDFLQLRAQKLAYVDKTHLVREVLDAGAQTILLPRPRRFGKTLNLSMVRCYFERGATEERWALFEGLSIASAGPSYRAHFGRYPVIAVSFKDVKAARWDLAWDKIQSLVAGLFEEHRALLTGAALSPRETERVEAVLRGTANREVVESSLLDLSRMLARITGERVVILIDEYDTPIHAAYASGYAGEVLSFFRAFLGAGLKDNNHLFKAVLTGILRVSKESIFSDLNNIAVYSLLRSAFSSCFGFSEAEVEGLLVEAGCPSLLPDVRAWYNGYVFGGAVVYNPWSILSFIDDADKTLRPYWVSTSSNDLIREALAKHASEVRWEMETLLEGGFVEQRLDENVVLADLPRSKSTLFDLLVFSGYLKAERADPSAREEAAYRLSIPNREVREVFTSTFARWMEQHLGGRREAMERLTRALFGGDAEALEEQLQTFLESAVSYHDLGRAPEVAYHMFVLGLLTIMEPSYQVRSNREMGEGRPDVTIAPNEPGKPGAVLELKVARAGKKTPKKALEEGLAQIRSRDYTAELRARGAAPIYAFAVAFDGKRVWVERAPHERAPKRRAPVKRSSKRT